MKEIGLEDVYLYQTNLFVLTCLKMNDNQIKDRIDVYLYQTKFVDLL